MAAGKYSATLVNANDALTVSTVEQGTVGVQLTDGGSFSGTITFEATVDGSDWVAIKGTPLGSTTGASSTTSVGIWQVPVQGMNQFRARFSTATAGKAIINIQTCPAGVTKY